MDSSVTAAQQAFDETYIGAGEICRELHVTRPTVTNAQKRGLLPPPIVVAESQVYLWDRAKVRPYLDAWKLNLKARRRELTTEHTA